LDEFSIDAATNYAASQAQYLVGSQDTTEAIDQLLSKRRSTQLMAKIDIETDRRANHFALDIFLPILRQSIVATS
jgi:hypothetical protein